MAPLGGGFIKNIEHKHFWKVLIIFALIVAAGALGYHQWLKHEVLKERQQILQGFQAQRQPPVPQ